MARMARGVLPVVGLFACLMALASVQAGLPSQPFTLPAGIGNGLWRTFSLAIKGEAPPLPLSASAAAAAGWYAQGSGACDPNKGILYTQSADGASEDHPLGIYYTQGGQVAGLQVTVYGSAWSSKIGPAAQPQLVSEGIWIASQSQRDTWSMTVSFRAAADMCSGAASAHEIGDRIVVGQGGANVYIPLTAAEAKSTNWQPGACMKTMGQHWFYDNQDAPDMSWVAGNLLPVVPMYYPTDGTGTINAIFFTTPVVQKGSNMFSKADWETPFLPDALMCQNWCNKGCHWNTQAWSTMHIYLNSQWKTIMCDGGSGPVDRSCPNGNQGTATVPWYDNLEADTGASTATTPASPSSGPSKPAFIAVAAVACVAVVVAAVAVVVAIRSRREAASLSSMAAAGAQNL